MSDNSKKMAVGVDLGTSNLLIYVEGRGTVFNEPSIIAIDKATKKVVNVGIKAANLVGKTHEKVEVIRPLSGGVIADVEMIKELLEFTLDTIFLSKMDNIRKMLICIPSEITETEKQAICLLGHGMGIDNVMIDAEVKAAAIGNGLDIYEPRGQFVIDIGGGTTDFGVLSLGEVVLSRATKVAGEYFDRQIIEHVKNTHKLEIGDQTAEKIKIALASIDGDLPVDEDGHELTYIAKGRDQVEGLPQQAIIFAHEIREVLLRCFETIKSTLIATLEVTPPELSGDLVTNGIWVSGGGAKILGLKQYFEAIARVPVHISDHPLTAVINGTKKLLQFEGKHYFGESRVGMEARAQ
ncbi:MAG: rod shape-determining protein [Candidatus Izemoplasmatales bacterium]